jgi:sugar phosphate permease
MTENAYTGMLLFSNNIRLVLWIAVIPAELSVLILALKVKEPATHQEKTSRVPFHFKVVKRFSSAYWQNVVIAGLCTLARFSQAFLTLKAQATGLSLAFIPLIVVLMNVIYAFAAYPAGILSDNVNRTFVLVIDIVFLTVADIVLGFHE